MRLRRLEDHAAHVSRGILPAPGVFVLEVGENARPVALCLVVRTCKNGSRDTDDEIAESVAVLVDPSPTCEESAKPDDVTSDEFIDAKLNRAFGASILQSDGGGFDDQWGSW